MTIRAEFQPVIDEFITDLTSFATGSYLKEDEKEFWEQPFDVSVLPELKSLLEKLLNTLDALPADPTAETLGAVIQTSIDELEEFNTRQHGAVLEPEEKQELEELIHDASAATGADDEALAELPEFD